MAVSFQSVQTTTNNTSTNSCVITKPVSTAQNDLLIAHIVVAISSPTITPPSGWTELDNRTLGSTDRRSLIYWKLAGASETATYTWGFSSTESNNGSVVRITGHNLTTPINTSSGQVNAGASLSCAIPTITPAANCLIMLFATPGGGQTCSGYTITTSPPTFTERYDATSSFGSIAMATGTRSASTATGAGAVTLSGSTGSLGHILAIAPGEDVSTNAGLFAMTLSQIQNAYASTLSATISLLALTISKWTNKTKSSSSWTNTNKS